MKTNIYKALASTKCSPKRSCDYSHSSDTRFTLKKKHISCGKIQAIWELSFIKPKSASLRLLFNQHILLFPLMKTPHNGVSRYTYSSNGLPLNLGQYVMVLSKLSMNAMFWSWSPIHSTSMNAPQNFKVKTTDPVPPSLFGFFFKHSVCRKWVVSSAFSMTLCLNKCSESNIWILRF